MYILIIIFINLFQLFLLIEITYILIIFILKGTIRFVYILIIIFINLFQLYLLIKIT